MATWYSVEAQRPHSYQVQLDDGRIWRRHVDNILQNNPTIKPAEPATPSVEVPRPSSAVEISHAPPGDIAESSAPVQDASRRKESAPVPPASPTLRRSSRISKPTQRHIEEM